MLLPGNLDLTILQGATFLKVLRRKDSEGTLIPMVGWTARMQARARVDAEEVLIDLTTENGGITILGPEAEIELHMTDEQTEALSFKRARYDLELLPPTGGVIRLLQGQVFLSKEVTRGD